MSLTPKAIQTHTQGVWIGTPHLIDEGVQCLHEALLIFKVRHEKFHPRLQRRGSAAERRRIKRRKDVMGSSHGAHLQESEHSQLHHMQVIGVAVRLR